MNPTHLIITNRAAISGDWIHVVPKGELPNREAKVVQVLDDAALDSILANIAADRERLGERWPGIYAGREHFIYNDDQDSAALAWFKDFEKRDDGIWAKKDGLTPIGQQVIANSEYKFTSFVADRRDTQKLEGNKVRILKLDTIGFTNQANGKELLTPITNRSDFPGASASAAKQQHNQRTMTMKSIAQKLGLAAEASEEAILDGVIKLQNRIATLEPLQAENTTLKNRIATQDGESVDALLDLHQVKDEKLRNRLKPVLVPLANREERVAALLDFGHKPAEAGKTTASTRLINRKDGKQTETATEAADEQELAQKLTNRATELKNGSNRDWDSCFQQAQRELAAK